MIYSPKKQNLLRNDPGVTVTLPNDEEYRLKPLKLNDRPVKRKALTQIRHLMTSSQDDDVWNNLLPFLEGMHQSKEHIHHDFYGAIARKLNQLGKYHIALRCAERAATTDFRLCYPAITKKMFRGCHDRAVASTFKGEESTSAFNQAEHMALLLEKEEHCGGKLPAGGRDMRQSLMVMGVLLEMAAAKSIHHHGSKDPDGKVASYSRRALALSDPLFKSVSEARANMDSDFDEAGNLVTEPADPRRTKRKPTKSALAAMKGAFINDYLPLWHGMKLASRVQDAIGSDIKMTFDQRCAWLGEQLESRVAEIRSNPELQCKSALKRWEEVKSL